MKGFILAIALLTLTNVSHSEVVLSQFEEGCRFIYRTAYLDLSTDVDGFNNKILSKYEMSARLAALSADITASSAQCEVMKVNPDTKCSAQYKDLYTVLRNKISLPKILSGSQASVDRGLFGSDKAKEKIRLNLIDLKCRN